MRLSSGPRENASSINIVGDIKGKTTIIIDDIIDTGRRITSASKALIENGAKEVYACTTHPVLSGLALSNVQNAPIKELIVTNSIELSEEKRIDKITQLTVAPVVAEAIIRLYEQQSVSSLYI